MASVLNTDISRNDTALLPGSIWMTYDGWPQIDRYVGLLVGSLQHLWQVSAPVYLRRRSHVTHGQTTPPKFARNNLLWVSGSRLGVEVKVKWAAFKLHLGSDYKKAKWALWWQSAFSREKGLWSVESRKHLQRRSSEHARVCVFGYYLWYQYVFSLCRLKNTLKLYALKSFR